VQSEWNDSADVVLRLNHLCTTVFVLLGHDDNCANEHTAGSLSKSMNHQGKNSLIEKKGRGLKEN
jgi:hypothetical protein